MTTTDPAPPRTTAPGPNPAPPRTTAPDPNPAPPRTTTPGPAPTATPRPPHPSPGPHERRHSAMDTTGTTTPALTLDDVRKVLTEAVAAEAGVTPAELETDRAFSDYGLDSMAALSVGMEIEDSFGLTDPPVDLLWDHPTVDTLSVALWQLISTGSLPAPAAEDQR